MARFTVGLSLFCMLLVSDPAINSAFAQTTTGLIPFATINSSLYDAVKVNDGAILLTLPVRSKAGLIPFDYSLTLNSTVGISGVYVLINTLQWSPRTSVNFGPGVSGGFATRQELQCSKGKTFQGTNYQIIDASGTVTPGNQQLFTDLGFPQSLGRNVDVINLVSIARRSGPLGSIGPVSFDNRAADCGVGAAGALAKDLTGMSTLEGVVNAATIPSLQPLLNPENALDAAETAGDVASKVLSGTPARIAGGFGKAAGRAGSVFSIAMAAKGFGSCMGW
jgi:hypothetical protein